MKRKHTAPVLFVVGLMLALSAAVTAAEPPTRQELLDMIQALKTHNKGLEQRLADLEAKVVRGGGPELNREQVRALVEQMLAESRDAMTPGWMENLTFFGDFRLRYEYRQRAESPGGLFDNEGRARYRLRVGVKKKWPQDDLEVGFRIASGDNGGGPTSTNDTMGDAFFRDNWDIDRAYARWTPKRFPGLLLTGGKIAQPWITSDLVWDSDLNPEGVWVQYDVPGLGDITPFVAVGELFITNVNPGKDASMHIYATGYHWKPEKGVTWTQAFNFYETSHYTAGLSADEEWDYFNLMNVLAFKAGSVPMQTYLDWVHNCAANSNTPNAQKDGIKVGVKVGSKKKKGDWAASYSYRYVQMEAVPPAFNDADFPDGHKGHEMIVSYNLTDYMLAEMDLIHAQPIYKPAVYGDRTTLQFDLIWKF